MEQHFTRGFNRGAQAPIVDIKYDDEQYLGVVSISNRSDMRVNVEYDTIILVSHFQPYGTSYLIQGKQYHYGFVDTPTADEKRSRKLYDEIKEWTFVYSSVVSTIDTNNHPFVTTKDVTIGKTPKLTKSPPFIEWREVKKEISVLPVGWYQKPFQTDVEVIPMCGNSIRILHKSDEFQEILGQ